MKSENLDFIEQACLGLGNIAGDNTSFRDIVLDSGALKQIIEVIWKTESNPQ